MAAFMPSRYEHAAACSATCLNSAESCCSDTPPQFWPMSAWSQALAHHAATESYAISASDNQFRSVHGREALDAMPVKMSYTHGSLRVLLLHHNILQSCSDLVSTGLFSLSVSSSSLRSTNSSASTDAGRPSGMIRIAAGCEAIVLGSKMRFRPAGTGIQFPNFSSQRACL